MGIIRGDKRALGMRHIGTLLMGQKVISKVTIWLIQIGQKVTCKVPKDVTKRRHLCDILIGQNVTCIVPKRCDKMSPFT